MGCVVVFGLVGVGVTFFQSPVRSPSGAVAAPVAAMAPVATTVAVPVAASTPVMSAVSAEPTLPPTTRNWDASVAGIVHDPVLASRLDQTLVGVDGHVAVAVKDLGSGRGAVLGGDQELQAASLYKLPVLYTVFDAGLGMNEPLTITEDALSYDAGTMELGAGETLTVAEALERMVTLSDNTSAIMLAGRVGPTRINKEIADLGLETTHYSLERMTTSSLDMLHVLEQIATGRAVSASASADMVHLLLRQRVNDRLPRLLPDDVRVAHKTGNLPGVVNDVGILYGQSSTVIVAALVSDTTDEAAAATAIAELAQVANAYFEEEPQAQARPTIPPAPARPIPPTYREPKPPTAIPVPVVPTSVAAVEEVTSTVVAAPTVAPTSIPAVKSSLAPTAKPTPPPAPTATPAPPPPTPSPVPPTAVPTKPAPTPVRPGATATPGKRV